MDNTNILFTSSGRRDYFIDYFISALRGRGIVHVANSSPICSSFTTGDKRIVTPPIYSDLYIPFLLDYCRENKISIIIPLFDIDLPVLADSRNKFDAINCRLLVAKSDIVKICNDKWLTFNFLTKHGFNTPLTFIDVPSAISAVKRSEATFPLIVKPRWGMGSLGLMKADDPDHLDVIYNLVQNEVFTGYLKHESQSDINQCVIIQNRAHGDEFGLDVFNDLEGNHITSVPKRKLAMRSGETDSAMTVDNPLLKEQGRRLGNLLAHPGNLDVDIFYDGKNYEILEMNCRFGGGYPFTHLAGCNFPLAIISWLMNENPDPSCFNAVTNVIGVKSMIPKILES
jgi:carbamoyl-phosphate synthase large subunit